MKDVARAANVSVPTASRILRRKGIARFSEETCERVLQAAARLRYRPNMLVKGLQTGLTNTVGVMVPPFDSYWSSILYGIHDTLISLDYVPIVLWVWHRDDYSGKEPFDNLEPVHRLIDRRIDGAILWPPVTPEYYGHHEELASRNIPVVTIDHELPSQYGADSITTNEELGARIVADHLIKLGHRRIAHLGDVGLDTYSWSQGRRKYFEQQIAKVPGTSCIISERDKKVDGIEVAKKILTAKPRPTAVYAANDLLARYVYLAAAELNLRIPEDVSVVGFADLDFAPLMVPPLTTVRQKGYEIGCKAARLLLSRIQGKFVESENGSIKMDCELVVRGSTAPVPRNS
ncbi:MAG: LacI family DNA-binding transcriptional regulator [Sedimentisphaerales bacterium]|nr:LacI family DNA-binding transcriptional regulator [Sedimentisphaerales bacterium]